NTRKEICRLAPDRPEARTQNTPSAPGEPGGQEEGTPSQAQTQAVQTRCQTSQAGRQESQTRLGRSRARARGGADRGIHDPTQITESSQGSDAQWQAESSRRSSIANPLQAAPHLVQTLARRDPDSADDAASKSAHDQIASPHHILSN